MTKPERIYAPSQKWAISCATSLFSVFWSFMAVSLYFAVDNWSLCWLSLSRKHHSVLFWCYIPSICILTDRPRWAGTSSKYSIPQTYIRRSWHIKTYTIGIIVGFSAGLSIFMTTTLFPILHRIIPQDTYLTLCRSMTALRQKKWKLIDQVYFAMPSQPYSFPWYMPLIKLRPDLDWAGTLSLWWASKWSLDKSVPSRSRESIFPPLPTRLIQ